MPQKNQKNEDKKETIVLGIETSCDDTSVAILVGQQSEAQKSEQVPRLLAHLSFNQESMLRKWGGVVPEIASRNHMMKLAPLIEEALAQANITMSAIDLIGVTTHPGLMGPLLTGLNTAKTIALLKEKPIVGVNHLYAHLEAIFLRTPVTYPYLGLLVSGGHSVFLRVNSPLDFQVLGTTLDDAAGEAFDKGGKLMGLGYPAGRLIDELAQKGNIHRHTFPIGLKNSGDANLSYSGIKTSLRNLLEKNPQWVCSGPHRLEQFEHKQDLADLCASYQHAIVEALLLKLPFAFQKAQLPKDNTPLVVGGGVACNSYLRQQLQKQYPYVHFVPPQFCTDNGAMVANYAYRIRHNAIPYPQCLSIDCHNRAVRKERQ